MRYELTDFEWAAIRSKAPYLPYKLRRKIARRASQSSGRSSRCPAPLAKIFRLTRRANHLYKLAPSHPRRGQVFAAWPQHQVDRTDGSVVDVLAANLRPFVRMKCRSIRT